MSHAQKKRGTLGLFLTPGVWRNPINRITKSPRINARAFCYILIETFIVAKLWGLQNKLNAFPICYMCIKFMLLFHRPFIFISVNDIYLLSQINNEQVSSIFV